MNKPSHYCLRLLPVSAGLAAALLLAACSDDGKAPTAAPTEAATLTATSVTSATPEPTSTAPALPTAPESARVDVEPPAFSNPTAVTNPLFPIANLRSAVLVGIVDGLPFRTETTLLPGTKTIMIDGRPVETLVSQYTAFLDGRLHEVALDWYAQADDGSAWYLGEDVFNYEDGVVADTNGTWVAGKEGPAAMIMPGDPRVGQVYRPENAPGVVFEEVTVKETGVTVDGPSGEIRGAIIVDELHMDGTHEEKIFAPGYGEFSTGSPGNDIEALALAVPIDALDGPVPAELTTMFEAALALAGEGGATGDFAAAWQAYRDGNQMPPLLAQEVDLRLAGVDSGVEEGAGDPGLRLALAVLDLQLRHRPVTEIDRERFAIWLEQLALDVEHGDGAGIAGDSATLQWTWDRFAHTLSDTARGDGQQLLDSLAAAAEGADVEAAGAFGRQLATLVS